MAIRATCTTECLRAGQQRHTEDFAVYTVPMLCNTPASRAGCLTQFTVHALEAPVGGYPEALTHLATTYHGEPSHGEQTNYASDTHGERGFSALSEGHVATLDCGLEHPDTHTDGPVAEQAPSFRASIRTCVCLSHFLTPQVQNCRVRVGVHQGFGFCQQLIAGS